MHVAAAIIKNTENKILIAERPKGKYAAGLWEFPGGKIEKNESIFKALQREILEEVNLHIISASPWLKTHYDYVDRSVTLDFWLVEEFSGEAKGMEGQLVRWVNIQELSQYTFPEGNKPVLEKLFI